MNHSSFGQNFWPQALATLIGVLIALLIDLFIRRSIERKEHSRLIAGKAAERKYLLTSLLDTLKRDRRLLEQMKQEVGPDYVIFYHVDLTLFEATAKIKYEIIDDPGLNETIDTLRYELEHLCRKVDMQFKMQYSAIRLKHDLYEAIHKGITDSISQHIPHILPQLDSIIKTVQDYLSKLAEKKPMKAKDKKRLLFPRNLFEWASLVSLLLSIFLGIYMFLFLSPSQKKSLDYAKAINEPSINAYFITDLFDKKFLLSDSIPLMARSYNKEKNDPITGELWGQRWWVDGKELTGTRLGFLVIECGNKVANNVKLNIWRSYYYPETGLDKTQYWSKEDSIKWEEEKYVLLHILKVPDSSFNMFKLLELSQSLGIGETNIFLGNFQPGDTKTIVFRMEFPKPPHDTSDCVIRELFYQKMDRFDILKMQLRCDNHAPVDVKWEYRRIS